MNLKLILKGDLTHRTIELQLLKPNPTIEDLLNMFHETTGMHKYHTKDGRGTTPPKTKPNEELIFSKTLYGRGVMSDGAFKIICEYTINEHRVEDKHLKISSLGIKDMDTITLMVFKYMRID